MSRLSKFIPLYIIIVSAVLCLCGCSAVHSYDGAERVDKAKRLHTALEAAHIEVIDDIDHVKVQEIDYRFAGDVMQYMYIGRDSGTGEVYYEFNNGTELDTWHSGDTEWSFAAKGSEDYYGYSRAKRHYFADGAQLLGDHAAAVSSAEIAESYGTTSVVIKYDDNAVSSQPDMQGVAGYEQIYTFEGDMCSVLTVSYKKDGRDYRYITLISRRDADKPVERAEPPGLADNKAGDAQ